MMLKQRRWLGIVGFFAAVASLGALVQAGGPSPKESGAPAPASSEPATFIALTPAIVGSANNNSQPEDTQPASESPKVLEGGAPDLEQPPAALTIEPGLLAPLPEAKPERAETITISMAMSPRALALRDPVRRTLAWYQRRQLNTRDNNPWDILHSIMAYGVETEIHRGSPNGPSINAIGYLCINGQCAGEQLFAAENNHLEGRKGIGVQWECGECLAVLAQAHVMPDYPINVGKMPYSVDDLIATEQLACDKDNDLTSKLISLSHYLESDTTWKNARGEKWSISRLINEEISSPINDAACGGTHRLMALSYAVFRRDQQDKPLDGEYLRAETYTADFQRIAWTQQNADGSFSTNWFKGKGDQSDLGRKLQTTGHILEWLVFAVPEEQLQEPQMVKAVEYLNGLLSKNRTRQWEIGPLSHALHALAMYDERLFKVADGATPKVARLPKHPDLEPAPISPPVAPIPPATVLKPASPKTVAPKMTTPTMTAPRFSAPTLTAPKIATPKLETTAPRRPIVLPPALQRLARPNVPSAPLPKLEKAAPPKIESTPPTTLPPAEEKPAPPADAPADEGLQLIKPR